MRTRPDAALALSDVNVNAALGTITSYHPRARPAEKAHDARATFDSYGRSRAAVLEAFGAAVFEVRALGAAVADVKEIWGDFPSEVTSGAAPQIK